MEGLTRTCPVCEAHFQTERADQKNCSRYCTVRAADLRRRERNKAQQAAAPPLEAPVLPVLTMTDLAAAFDQITPEPTQPFNPLAFLDWKPDRREHCWHKHSFEAGTTGVSHRVDLCCFCGNKRTEVFRVIKSPVGAHGKRLPSPPLEHEVLECVVSGECVTE